MLPKMHTTTTLKHVTFEVFTCEHSLLADLSASPREASQHRRMFPLSLSCRVSSFGSVLQLGLCFYHPLFFHFFSEKLKKLKSSGKEQANIKYQSGGEEKTQGAGQSERGRKEVRGTSVPRSNQKRKPPGQPRRNRCRITGGECV